MKKTSLTLSLLLVLFASNVWAYNETDLLKFKAINQCPGCDLSEVDLKGATFFEANLEGANLSDTDLTTSNLRNVKLDGVIYCKTKMPWGELNDGCR